MTGTKTKTAAAKSKLPSGPGASLVRDMRVEWREIAKLTPYAKNARLHSENQLARLCESLTQFGWAAPVIVAGADVVAGHGRLLAAAQLGELWAPCLDVKHLTEAQVRAYRIADNRLAELSTWDTGLLRVEIGELSAIDVNLPSLAGFTLTEIEQVIGLPPAPDGQGDPDEVPEPPVTPVSKTGDLWLLGKHRLLCEDSTKAATLKRLSRRATVAVVLTDPPYGMHLNTDFSGAQGKLGKTGTKGNTYAPVRGDGADFSPELISTLFRAFDCPEMFLFGADYYAELLPDRNAGSWLVWDKRKTSQAEAFGSEFELCWSRRRHKRRTLRHDWFGFLSSENAAEAQQRSHPTQKPTSLLRDMLEQWSKPQSIVADPYVGSGSTIIACEQTERHCYAVELEPQYIDVAVRRWQTFTGKLGTLDGDGRTFGEIAQERLSGKAG